MRNKMQKNKSIFWWVFLVTVILSQSVVFANENKDIANQEVVSYFTTFYGKQNGLESKNFNKKHIHILQDVRKAFPLMRSLGDDETYVLLENDLPDIFNEK